MKRGCSGQKVVPYQYAGPIEALMVTVGAIGPTEPIQVRQESMASQYILLAIINV